MIGPATDTPPASACRALGHHTLAGLVAHVRADVVRYLHRSPESAAGGDDLLHRASAFMTPQLHCLLLHRVSHLLEVRGHRRLARLVAFMNLALHKSAITPQSCIGPACLLPHPAAITFHGTAGRELTLYSLATCCPREAFADPPLAAGPVLGDRVSVGGLAVVTGPVRLGDDVRVAHTVCLERDAPAGVLVVSRALRQTRRRIPDTRAENVSRGA